MPISILGNNIKIKSTKLRHQTVRDSTTINRDIRFVCCSNKEPITLTLPPITNDVAMITIYASNAFVDVKPFGSDKIELKLTLSDETLVELISDYATRTWRIN